MKKLEEVYDSVRQHLESFVASGTEKLQQDLPVLADWVAKAAQNPVIAALAEAEHLPGAPEVLARLADEIRALDAALGTAKAAGAAEAHQAHEAAAQAAAEAAVPAEGGSAE